ncbi:MAG TPA: enoyl-CoA hydratase/isomerase family protein [Pseudonocardiaceae bacterium]|nr:enoyl-CoA hydratase/isomerase family protein [Pseudonocardiaceae bacterium]
MTGDGVLDIGERSGVAIVRLCHGKVNAMDTELLAAIASAMRDIDLGVPIVLTGTDPTFSAGADLHRIIDGGPSYVEDFLSALSEAVLAVFDRPAPVVAAVNGHAIAGGCVLAAACDLRMMSGGRIGLSELSVGVPFPAAALEIMRHRVGPSLGNLVLTAALLDPAQALAVGLVDRSVRPGELLEGAIAQARRMGGISAEVFAFTKRALHAPVHERLATSAEDDRTVARIWFSARTRETISAYLESLRRPTAAAP